MRDDVIAAIRSLRRSPGFTASVLIILALAIGAGTVIFSAVDAIALRGLPFDEHDRIVAVLEHDPKQAVTLGGGTTTAPTFVDWRRHQDSFERLAATTAGTLWLSGAGGEPVRMRVTSVTADFFPLVRISPQLGRAFAPDEEIDGRHRVVILSDGLWRGYFGAAPDVVGRTLTLNDETWEVVGVTPRGFSYPLSATEPTDLYVPLAFKARDLTRGGSRNYGLAVIGRLKPGASLAQAGAAMNRIAAALDTQFPAWSPGREVRVVPLHEHLTGRVRSWMLLLLGAVCVVLLIASVNVASLLLARGSVRAAELATRAALGAGRWRLVRAVLAEAMVLWGSATALGIGLAFGGAPLVRAWIPPEAPRVSTIAIDLRVLALTIAAALVTSLVCGLWPALASSRPDLQLTLRAAGRSGASTVGQRLRSILVVAEIALAVVLLVGAGLFIFSFARLTAIEPGFDYRNLLVLNVGVTVQPGRLDEALKQGLPYLQRVSDVIRATPGVQDVALVNGGLPLSGGFSRTRVSLPGGPELSGDDAVIDRRSVSPGYLTLLRVPLRRGRHLSDADRETSEQVAVVNETAARRYWPGRDPIGQRLLINAVERTIVGVVGDIRHLGPEAPPRPEAYVPLAQDPVTGATVLARVSDPLAILPSVRSAIWSVNPRQRLLEDTVTLEAYMNRLVAQRRFNMALLSLFGVLGLFIAALGLYSLMAYTVAQRTSEIGLRMALGATRSQIVGGVLGRSASLLGLGLCLGGVGVWALRASVGAFLFETTPGDPGVLAGAVSVLIAVGLLATAIPATRASRVDPAIALRNE